MHNQLEQYLSEVGAHLSALPVKQRNEELREMRAHLENAVIVSRELGQSEEEAAQNIMEQFGPAQDLSENVVWAWRRGLTRKKEGFWSGAICGFAMVTLPSLIPGFLTGDFGPHAPMSPAVFDLAIASPFAICVVGAAIAGGRYPKQAVAGTAVGTIPYFACCIGEFLLTGHGHVPPSPNALRVAAGFAGEGVTALFAAWAGSRWRMRGAKRSRQAVGL